MIGGVGMQLSTNQFFSLWEALEESSRAPVLGLTLVEGFEPDSPDSAAMVAAQAVSLGGALKKLASMHLSFVAAERDGNIGFVP